MEKNLVGYRFCPTGEELINYYLKNKILGNSWLVDVAISEINICCHEPALLPSLSKLESNDRVWYFFSLKEYYSSAKKKVLKRTTSTGFWKATGKDRKIKDRRGVEIGIKKTLVYHEGKANKGVWTPWAMHEYHITSLPLLQSAYVICQVMYKGADGDISYGNNKNELSHSMVTESSTSRALNTAPEVNQPIQEDIYGICEDDLVNPMNEHKDPTLFHIEAYLNEDFPYPYLQPQTPYEEEYFKEFLSSIGGNNDDEVPNAELFVQENHNDHRPKKPLSGVIVDCSSDSEPESISETSYRGTSSSPGGSDGSPNRHYRTSAEEILSLSKESRKDNKQTSAETFINGKTRASHLTRRTKPLKREVKEGKSKAFDASMDKKKSAAMVKIEKKGWFITEEQRNHKNPQYIYLMNMIIGFILLVAVIGNITSVLRSAKN